jgi:hypothetical protein
MVWHPPYKWEKRRFDSYIGYLQGREARTSRQPHKLEIGGSNPPSATDVRQSEAGQLGHCFSDVTSHVLAYR